MYKIILLILIVVIVIAGGLWYLNSVPSFFADSMPESANGDISNNEETVLVGDTTEDEGDIAGKKVTYTMADVAAHGTKANCWVTINGTVYDVTSWIPRHPGGEARILAICGTDATNAFTTQHDGAPKPNEMLAGFEIGVLTQ